MIWLIFALIFILFLIDYIFYKKLQLLEIKFKNTLSYIDIYYENQYRVFKEQIREMKR